MKYLKIPGVLLFVTVCSCGGQDAPARVSAAQLQAQVREPAVRKFYESRQWQAGWSARSARQLEEALADRAVHGLDRVKFPEPPSGQSGAAREAGLTASALAYAKALATGVTDPHELHDLYTIPTARFDLIAGLDAALENNRLREWLESLAPASDEYRAISRSYRKWREAGAEDPEASVPAGDDIEPGARDPRVPRIVQALARHGYRPGSTAAAEDPALYSEAIASAVRRFQDDLGIRSEGIVGPDTIEALNTSAEDKARAAAVALERRRWLERDPPSTRIDVNIAAATLEYIREGRVVDRRRLVVGRPDWQTPQLQSQMHRLVANPTWTVPKSIEREELAGLGSGQLRRRNMVRRDGWIVQQSGPDNALGLVKFDLRHDHAIYLHDTPAKPLFERSRRQLSHGCVRVDDALQFASMIAGHQRITGKWQSALQTGEETFVALPQPITVRLLYHPTHLAVSGEVVSQMDVYDLNERVASRLGFSGGRSKTFRPDVEDLGP